MRVDYSKNSDSAYIYLKDNIGDGEVKMTYPCDPLDVNGMINLDFDKDENLLELKSLTQVKNFHKKH